MFILKNSLHISKYDLFYDLQMVKMSKQNVIIYKQNRHYWNFKYFFIFLLKFFIFLLKLIHLLRDVKIEF